MLGTASVAALRDAVGRPEDVELGDSVRDIHSRDESFHPPHRPDAVVFARSRDDVCAVLEVAHERRIPVVPFAAGSSLEGHVIPVAGGLSLDLSGMDRIRAVHAADLAATVEPGVPRSQLERRAADHGLWFPVDPGADATLGGMAATNAAGTTTLRYGKMRAQVLALEAVLPGGRVIRTGSRAAKTSAGYDLTGLFVGSEGTLGVITELTVRLRPIPEASVSVRAVFSTLERAGYAAAALVAVGAVVERLELIDDWVVEGLGRLHGPTLRPGNLLAIEVAGAPDAVEAELETVEVALSEAGALEVDVLRERAAQRKLWRLRHDVFYAEREMAPGTASLSTDVCVPVSALPAALARTRAALDRLGLTGGIVSHAGDGNIHVGLCIDPDSAEELGRGRELVDALVEDALAVGGTCSGEHGIGLGKIELLEREHGELLPLMRGIKDTFDPHGIMNPGKVLPAPRGGGMAPST